MDAVGDYRTGEVIAQNDDGSVDIEWSDGTRSTLRRKLRPSDRMTPCGNPQCPCSVMPREGDQQ